LRRYSFLFLLIGSYKAGACLPFPVPFGCLWQELAVNPEIVEAAVPQNLQLYLVFSLPSYNLCFPLPLPRG
jgi:hypothetical protein